MEEERLENPFRSVVIKERKEIKWQLKECMRSIKEWSNCLEQGSCVISHDNHVSGTDYAHPNPQVFTQVVPLPGVFSLPFIPCLLSFPLSQILTILQGPAAQSTFAFLRSLSLLIWPFSRFCNGTQGFLLPSQLDSKDQVSASLYLL